jgi:hypothetical protein
VFDPVSHSRGHNCAVALGTAFCKTRHVALDVERDGNSKPMSRKCHMPSLALEHV